MTSSRIRVVSQTIATCYKHGEGVVFVVNFRWSCPICRPDHPDNPVLGLSGLNLFRQVSS